MGDMIKKQDKTFEDIRQKTKRRRGVLVRKRFANSFRL